MILVDLNNVIFGRIIIEFSKEKLDKDLLRHIVLDTIQRRILTHRSEYGNVVIAKDGKKYWRKEAYPYYKKNREEQRAKSKINWPSLFQMMDELAEEFREFLPYPFIVVDGAEADDIITTMIKHHAAASENPNCLILSSDKDFAQLQKYPNVKQYNPNQKKWVTVPDPLIFLEEHVYRGDSSDGIPNVLNHDSCLVMKQRQKALTKKALDQWMGLNPKDVLPPSLHAHYDRNKLLIDLDMIPSHVVSAISEEYFKQIYKPKKSLFKYFIDNNLKNLMSEINDFY